MNGEWGYECSDNAPHEKLTLAFKSFPEWINDNLGASPPYPFVKCSNMETK